MQALPASDVRAKHIHLVPIDALLTHRPLIRVHSALVSAVGLVCLLSGQAARSGDREGGGGSTNIGLTSDDGCEPTKVDLGETGMVFPSQIARPVASSNAMNVALFHRMRIDWCLLGPNA